METKSFSVNPASANLLSRIRDQAGLQVRLCAVLDTQNALTIGHIQRQYLSLRGPDTLGVVTNRLRSSIRASAARVSGKTITSGIGSNVIYARAHEFGCTDTVPVPEHWRRNPMADLFAHAGGAVNRATALRMGLLSSKQSKSKQAVSKKGFKAAVQIASGALVKVKAHKRKMNIKARHYVAHGVDDRLLTIEGALASEIVSFWKGEQ